MVGLDDTVYADMIGSDYISDYILERFGIDYGK